MTQQSMRQTETTSSESQSQSHTATVLCVDDEANILSALRRLLRQEGYKLLFANNGVEGLAVLEQEPVDLVISDMRMPEMDGAKFLTEVARRWPETVRILLTGYSEVDSTIKAINQGGIYKYISKPWEDTDLKLTLRRAIEQKNLEQERRRLEDLTREQNEKLKALNANLEVQVQQRTEEIQQTLGMYESAYEELKRNYASTIDVFSNLIELRQGALQGECHQIPEAARRLATDLGLSAKEVEDIYHAAQLRDIGKIGLPDNLLGKPLGTLPAAARVRVLKHAVVGQGILMALDPLQDVASLIRHQNEKYDGTGQPDGLQGGEIPTGSRILAVLNDLFGLQSGRLTERKYSAEEARDFVIKNKGKRYDPEIVDRCFTVLSDLWEAVKEEEVLLVKSNGLQPGMVLARDLLSPDGTRLLTQGYRVTEETIVKIDNFERSMDEDLDIFVHLQ